MLLECDLGNSSCKWRIVDDGLIIENGLVDCGSVAHAWPLPRMPVTRIRAASVATPETNVLFETEIVVRYGLNVQWATSDQFCAGVTNAYSDYMSLGVDRWLAVVAAYNRVGAAIVIDTGSALTVDIVDDKGMHLGGYIAPGVELMAKSLLKDTAKVRFERSSTFRQFIIGQDTAGCVNAGIKAAQLGVVNSAISAVDSRSNASCTIVVTGGGAAELAEAMPEKTEVIADLVLDGLQWVLP